LQHIPSRNGHTGGYRFARECGAKSMALCNWRTPATLPHICTLKISMNTHSIFATLKTLALTSVLDLQGDVSTR
jgi:hypothetical protein